ncbi:MAG: histidine kinase dimerization/phospho-acceptor domain-containing protein [Vicinamibacteria bacterium]
MTDPLNPKLLAAVCHDLRGPLGAMGTWIHVLSSGRAKPETQAQALASIAADIQALSALIEQMSLLGTALSANDPISLVRLDIVPVLQSACSYNTEGRDVVATFGGDEASLWVSADSSQFQTLARVLTSRALTGRSGSRDLRVSRRDNDAELVVETTGGAPRALSVALVQALSEAQGGSLVQDAPRRSRLTVRFPLTTA